MEEDLLGIEDDLLGDEGMHSLLGTAEELRNVDGDRTPEHKRGLYPPKPPRRREYNPDTHCGRPTTTDGLPCTNPMGFQTPHPGTGSCKYHGGTSPGHIKHGLYSKVQSPSLLDAIQRVKESGVDTLDLAPEVEVLRAIVLDFVERRDEYTEAVIAFKQSFAPAITIAANADRTQDPVLMQKACRMIASAVNERPVEVIDVSAASVIIDRVGRMAERIHKMKQTSTLTWEAVSALLDRMGLVLAHHVKDADVIAAISKEWNEIEIKTEGGK